MSRHIFTTALLCEAFIMVSMFCGCASQPRVANPAPFNPMPGIWASILADIDQLKQNQASRTEWTKASDSATEIKTIEELRQVIKDTGAPVDEIKNKSDQAQMEKLFRTSHCIIHFGFECNFHEIVFFDEKDRQKYAYP